MHRVYKQDRQCAYNFTVRRVHETIVAVEKQCLTYFYVRVRAYVHACARGEGDGRGWVRVHGR